MAISAPYGAGVILGRAGVVVLRDDPRGLRVRLDGPPERRVAQAIALDPSLDRAGAELTAAAAEAHHGVSSP